MSVNDLPRVAACRKRCGTERPTRDLFIVSPAHNHYATEQREKKK